MANGGHVRWLLRELPELVRQDVIAPDAAARLQAHYAQTDVSASVATRWIVVLFSILGALLIGGGLILLLAHNWDELSRPLRALIAVTPLLLSSVFAARLLWTQSDSVAWREGLGTAQMLAVALAIALVAQTYHLGGRFEDFMFTWSLLSLPIAYLLRATLPAMLYLVGISIWVFALPYASRDGVWYWPLLAAALPYVWLCSRENSFHPRALLLLWVLAVSMPISMTQLADSITYQRGFWMLIWAGTFASLYLTGNRFFADASSFWQRPLQNIGVAGLVVLATMLSFSDVWTPTGWAALRADLDYPGTVVALLSSMLPLLVALLLWAWSWTQRRWHPLMLGAVPVLVLMCSATGINAAIPFNIFLSVYGVGTLIIGVRQRQLGAVNAGMAVLSVLFLCRFFDSDMSFVARGLAFVVIGAGFLCTNLVLLRWRKRHPDHDGGEDSGRAPPTSFNSQGGVQA